MLAYEGKLNYNGPDTLTVTSRDSNAVTDVDTVAITVLAVDNAPVITLPGAQLVIVVTALALAGITPPFPYTTLFRSQLAVANGTVTVTLSGTATISAGGNGTA